LSHPHSINSASRFIIQITGTHCNINSQLHTFFRQYDEGNHIKNGNY